MIRYATRLCHILMLCSVCTGQLHAQTVTLSSASGGLEVTGQLLHFDGVDYRIQTEFGALTVRGDGLTCAGWGCPKQDQLLEQFAFVGSGDLMTQMMPILIQEYAIARGDMAIGNPKDQSHLEMSLQSADLDTFAKVDLADNANALATLDPIYLGDPPDGDLGNFRQTIIARGAVLPILHPDNIVTTLSVEQISGILSGDITNWSELGGDDYPISIYAPHDLSDHPYQIPDPLTQAILLKTDAEVEHRVANRRGALGIVRYHYRTNSRVAAVTSGCSAPLMPTVFNIQSGEYPLGFDYVMYLPRKRLGPNQRGFIDWLKGKDAHKIMTENRYIGVWPDDMILDHQGPRLINSIQYLKNQTSTEILKEMLFDLQGAARLSATFRYNDTGDQLDAASRGYRAMLREALLRGEYERA